MIGLTLLLHLGSVPGSAAEDTFLPLRSSIPGDHTGVMKDEVISKLRGALSGELSEPQVFYILGLTRKLLDHRRGGGEHAYLRFFCDWAFHVEVSRSGAKRALRHFDDWSQALLGNEGKAADACRFFLLFRIHLEFEDLLRQCNLPAITEAWWCRFLSFYLEIIADCPASSGSDLGLRLVSELAIERAVTASGTAYFWKLALKSGETKRLPIDPDSFFRVTPTHKGEPWLWKGPVAAMVGLPEGWVTDNERNPDFQFSMYPVLYTRELAMKKSVFLYGKIVLKSTGWPTMEAIAEGHERVVLEKVPTARFERLKPLEKDVRPEGQFPRSLLRVGYVQESYGGPEYSLYIDSPKGVLLLVLLCPEGEDEKYVPVLRWMGFNSLMMTRQDDASPAEI